MVASVQKSRINQTLLVLISFATIVIGFGFTAWTWQTEEARLEAELLTQARMVVRTIDPRLITVLTGTEADLSLPSYIGLKERLASICSVKENCRFAYFTGIRDGKIFFYADSEPADSSEASPAGQIYDEAPDSLRWAFEESTRSIATYEDRWGNWVSAFVPLVNKQTGKVVAVFGMDVSQKEWTGHLIMMCAFPLTVTSLLVLFFVGFYIFYRRISKVQADIQKSEEKFRLLVENSRDVIVLTHPDGIIEYLSPACQDVFGWDSVEVVGKSTDEVMGFMIYKEDILKFKKIFEMASSGQKGTDFEYRVITKKGEVKWVLHSWAPALENGKLKTIVSVIRDINRRKLAEDKLRQEVNKVNALVLGIGDAVLVVDKERRIILFNRAAEEISGFSAQEVTGRKYDEVLRFIFEKDGKVNNIFIDYTLSSGEKQKIDKLMLIRKDGKSVSIADSVAPIRNAEGDIVSCAVVFRDVSKEREVDKMKSEFVSLASHQLRTPLTGIKWLAELLLKPKTGPLNNEQKNFVELIYSSNERLIKLVSDLLDVSHIETGRKFTLEKTNFDMTELIDDLIKEEVGQTAKRKITLQRSSGFPPAAVVLADREKISQVLLNLFDNAIRYSPEGSTVEVGLQLKLDELIVSVCDKGIGVPGRQQDRIFQKFFRADNAALVNASGNGLGLYIAKAMIEVHGGKMWLESEENKGATFYFSLPIIL